MNSRWARCLVFGGMFALLGSVTGCPDPDAIGKTVPVTGKVTIDDRALEGGAVNYVPDEAKGNKGLGASAMIKGGTYTLQTSSRTGNLKQGALPGWYKVTISTMSPMGMPADKPGEVKKDAPAGTGATAVPIAAAYTTPDKTPLSVEVKEGAPDSTYDLKAKSK
jgi:hypothetical protein